MTATPAPFGVRNVLAQLPPKPQTPTPGLGRVKIANPKSLAFPLKETLPARALTAPAWKTKRWAMGKNLHFTSQGTLSQCVEWALKHLHKMSPIVRPNADSLLDGLYEWAQRNDPWPGEEPAYYGTSVDSGLQYCLKVSKTISAYHSARNMDEVLGKLSVSAKDGGGPLDLGADFYAGMGENWQKDDRGVNIWHPTGEVWGGHSFLAIGHRAPTAKRPRYIDLGNSHDGNFVGTMSADEFEWLIFAQGGEAYGVTEIAK